MERVKKFLSKRDRFARMLGFELMELGEGYAKVQAKIGEEHLNAADVLHGGFLFSLADFAFAAASNSRDELSLAIGANILFHRAVTEGRVDAEAREIRDGRKIASYEVKIYDEAGDILATFSGTVYRKGRPLIHS